MPHITIGLTSIGLGLVATAPPLHADPQTEATVTYADIAQAAYGDSRDTAQALQRTVKALIDAPSQAALKAARDAWRAARVPYMQTEVFRFGNAIVDAWEGGVNAWPLDEGLIDYVDASYGGATDANDSAVRDVVTTPSLMISGRAVDTTVIDAALLRDTLQEAGGVESNVATGYHAIEFLLWGQDLNGTGPGAGDRPWTDYAPGAGCTNGHCDRRAAYLRTATDLLVADLTEMADAWGAQGPARAAVTGDAQAGLAAMLTGIGSLSYGELAGDRMQLGLLLNDPEEEHDCFSDNTHQSHFYDVQGIANVWAGTYGEIAGRGLRDVLAAADADLAATLDRQIAASLGAMDAIRDAVADGMAYDVMLARGNAQGEALITAAVEALVAQTRSVERAVIALGIEGVAAATDGADATFQ